MAVKYILEIDEVSSKYFFGKKSTIYPSACDEIRYLLFNNRALCRIEPKGINLNPSLFNLSQS